jgi:protein phosphatase
MIERAGFSDLGKQRSMNEDAWALPAPGVDEIRLGTLLVIADGTGGLPGGGEASQEAVHTMQALYYSAQNPENLSDRLRLCVEQVNALNRLAQRQAGLEKGHLTTLVAAVIHTDQIWVANVGDSRAYLVKAASMQLVQLTEDHSDYVRNVKAGLVSKADLASRESGVITRAIGLQDDCQVDIYHYTWSPGDRLLLCSDGLSHLTPEGIVSTLLDFRPEKAVYHLVADAVETDGRDNCTAMAAAWLEPDQANEAGGGLVENNPVLAAPLVPLPEQGADQDKRSASAPRARLQPGTRQLLFGILLGWLSALLIALLLISGRMMNIF